MRAALPATGGRRLRAFLIAAALSAGPGCSHHRGAGDAASPVDAVGRRAEIGAPLAPVIASAEAGGEAAPSSGADGAGGGTAEALVIEDEGAELWGVVLAGASEPGDPVLAGMVEDALGVGHVVGPTNCDLGAASAIGMDPATAFTVSVYADSEAEAVALRERLASDGLEGVVAQIVVRCPE